VWAAQGRAARTIATIPALMGSGSAGQASISPVLKLTGGEILASGMGSAAREFPTRQPGFRAAYDRLMASRPPTTAWRAPV
jgi:hypothetical protein